jgi:hypothetical protein
MKNLMIALLIGFMMSATACGKEEVCYPCQLTFGPGGEIPTKDSLVTECVKSYGYNVAEQTLRDRMVADGFAAYVDCRN